MDNAVNAVKPAPKHNYEDGYSKVLQGPCPAHPDSGYTIGDCRGLKSIYRSDAHKRQRGGDKEATKTIVKMTRGPMRRTRPKKNATRTLVMLIRTLIEASIASLVGKLSWRMGDRGSLPQAVMALNNPDGRVADPSIKIARTNLRSAELTTRPIS
jgi:hypothetical protein